MRRRRGAARLAMTCKRETCAEHPAPFCIRPAPSEAAPRGNSGARLFHLAAFAFYGPASRRPAKSAAAEIPCRLLLPPAAAARNPTIVPGSVPCPTIAMTSLVSVHRFSAWAPFSFFHRARRYLSFRQDEKKDRGAHCAGFILKTGNGTANFHASIWTDSKKAASQQLKQYQDLQNVIEEKGTINSTAI